MVCNHGKQNNTVKFGVPVFFGCSGVGGVPGCSRVFQGVLGCSGVPVFLVLVHAVLGRRMAR